MKSIQSGKLVVVTLPESICFYQHSSIDIVSKLGQLAESLHKTKTQETHGVMLLQANVAHDAVSPWIFELRNECLFNDLVQRIDAWRWVLSLIRNSPIPWTYAAAGNCFGSAWELALSCHHRYWFKSKSLLGFPEIEAGVFPPGGLLESLSKRAGRTRERWQANPFCSAKVALSDGLIDYCSDATDWHQQAKQIFSELIDVSPTAGVRPTRRTRPRHDFVSVDAQSRRAAYQQIEIVSQQEKFGKASGPTAWDYCWQLVSERAKLRQPADLGRIISLIASRYLLLPQYSTWLEKQSVTAQTLSTTFETEADIASAPLAIDLAQGAPPSSVLSRLLENNQQVLMIATDSRDLATELNLLYSRLERDLGNVAAQNLWERGVTWCQGRPLGFTGSVLCWTPDDYFIASITQVDYRFFRLSSNHIDAIPGILEFPGPETSIPRVIQNVLSYVSDAVIKTPKAFSEATPLSIKFRSLFLDELIRVSSHCDYDLTAAVDSLQRAGWGFAGDEELWERFLRTRSQFVPSRANYDLRSKLPKFDAEITSWKHAKQSAKRLKSKNNVRWNHVAFSRHMASYLGILARFAQNIGDAGPESTLNFLAGESLGLPQSLGTPLTFLKLRGSRRTDHYARDQWHHLLNAEQT